MQKRILIADDALFMRATLKRILTEHGYAICGEASNGKEAVEMFKTLKPDLVTMDITMPEMDGLAALKKIRSIDPVAKVVMCTAMGQKKIIIEAIEAGAKDYIIKPFQPDRIIQALDKILSI